MPTERFLRLPKEKAEIIRRAAIEEFKRVPPEDASINKIIQAAEISRGSFYTYFEDKYDLLKWLMGDFIGNYRRGYLDGLLEHDGDLWKVFAQVFRHTVQWVDEQGLVEIVGNMMKGTYFSEQMTNGASGGCELEAENRDYAEILYRHVDPACCTLETEEFHELMSMHAASLIVSLKMYFTGEKSMDEVEKMYLRRMKLLRYGACPQRTQSEHEIRKGQE